MSDMNQFFDRDDILLNIPIGFLIISSVLGTLFLFSLLKYKIIAYIVFSLSLNLLSVNISIGIHKPFKFKLDLA